MTEWQKMVAGELYDPLDAELTELRRRARDVIAIYNQTRDAEGEKRTRLLTDLMRSVGPRLLIEPPFFCDYGGNISIGENVFFNFNCVILDVAPVTIGDRCLFGPAVQIYAATHPLDAAVRSQGLELGKPVEIGSDVWVGGGAIICPGVSVGSRSVVGAGSVVTRDIPDDVFAAGNPCRVLREIK